MVNNSYFIDANIFLRYLTYDHPTFSPRAKEIFEQIAKKDIKAYINTLTLHEVIYVLKNVYNVKRNIITNNLAKLIELSNLFIIDMEKKDVQKALELYKNNNIDFPDCVYARIALSDNMKIISFDEDFRKLGVTVVY